MSELTQALERATLFRFLARLLQLPTEAGSRELAELAQELPEPLREKAHALAEELGPVRVHEYHRLMAPIGPCRDCESDYTSQLFGSKGPLLTDIAGFYRAFSFDPSSELPASPDHISAELGFLGYLAFKEAYALHREAREQVAICREAYDSFRATHLDTWILMFCDGLDEAASGTFYSRVAAFLRQTLPAQRPD
jgi:TorA maturation chaperone TorD